MKYEWEESDINSMVLVKNVRHDIKAIIARGYEPDTFALIQVGELELLSRSISAKDMANYLTCNQWEPTPNGNASLSGS